MGQYTDPAQANLVIGGGAFGNTQNYRRHELRGTLSALLRCGKEQSCGKVGGGYEFTEEQFNRVANGWGRSSTSRRTASPRSGRATTHRRPRSAARACTYSLFAQDDVSLGTRVSVNAGLAPESR